jgi:protein OS-9
MRASVALLCVALWAAACAADWIDINDPMYAIEYHGHADLAALAAADRDAAQRWSTMRLKNGTAFRCLQPVDATAAMREQALKARRELMNRPVPDSVAQALLEQSHGSCTIKIDGWWTYEVCFGKAVRQYHVPVSTDANKKPSIEQVYFMGKGPEHALHKGANGVLTLGESSLHGVYASTTYPNGTVCDKNGQQRTTEIRLLCRENEEDAVGIIDLSEPSTCTYLVWVRSELACKVPLLRKEAVAEQAIRCYEVPAAADAPRAAAVPEVEASDEPKDDDV